MYGNGVTYEDCVYVVEGCGLKVIRENMFDCTAWGNSELTHGQHMDLSSATHRLLCFVFL